MTTALEHHIPVIVSDDSHLLKRAPKHGLITENPIPNDVRGKLAVGRRLKRLRGHNGTNLNPVQHQISWTGHFRRMLAEISFCG